MLRAKEIFNEHYVVDEHSRIERKLVYKILEPSGVPKNSLCVLMRELGVGQVKIKGYYYFKIANKIPA